MGGGGEFEYIYASLLNYHRKPLEHGHLIILEWNGFWGQHVFGSISIQSLKVPQVPGRPDGLGTEP